VDTPRPSPRTNRTRHVPQVEFLNLIRTLRPEIAGALQSKDD